MTENTDEKTIDPATNPAALRSLAYSTFAAAFEYPDKDMLEAIRSGAVAEKFREILGGLSEEIIEDANWEALSDAGADGDDDALMVEFTRLFDTGTSGPPCALYGGIYTGARMKTMEEVVRFYNFFELSMSETPHELPDHITTQLEFLHFLTFLEATQAEKAEDCSNYQRAQRDFLARHPGRWIPQLYDKLVDQKPMIFILELTRLLNHFLRFEQQRLIALIGKVSTENNTQYIDVTNI